VTSVGALNDSGEQSVKDVLLNKRKDGTASQLQHSSEWEEKECLARRRKSRLSS
jgi:hypothetical protein